MPGMMDWRRRGDSPPARLEGTPILATTANAFSEDRWACLDAGMDDHAAKPGGIPMRCSPHPSPGRGRSDGRRRPLQPSALGSSGDRSAPRREAIPVLDREQGLRRLANRVATYERLLRSYAHDPNRELARLRERLEAGDRREAQRLAHSLKGSSATLGAVTVQAWRPPRAQRRSRRDGPRRVRVPDRGGGVDLLGPAHGHPGAAAGLGARRAGGTADSAGRTTCWSGWRRCWAWGYCRPHGVQGST